MIRVAGISLVTGEHTLAQDDFASIAKDRMRGGASQVVRFVCEQSGVVRRHFAIDPARVPGSKGWIPTVADAAYRLAERAARGLGDLSGADGIVVATSSSYGAPSVSRRLQSALSLPDDAHCLDVAGAGCSGGVQAWHVADMLLRQGARRVCVVSAEALGTVSLVPVVDPTIDEVVPRCICSDGAAAVLLVAGPDGGARDVSARSFAYDGCRIRSLLWKDTQTWNVLQARPETGAPQFAISMSIRERALAELRRIAPELGGTVHLHPGGRAILDSLEAGAVPGTALARRELEDGNFGSTSVLRVLARALDEGQPLASEVTLATFGPGKVTMLLALSGARR